MSSTNATNGVTTRLGLLLGLISSRAPTSLPWDRRSIPASSRVSLMAVPIMFPSSSSNFPPGRAIWPDQGSDALSTRLTKSTSRPSESPMIRVTAALSLPAIRDTQSRGRTIRIMVDNGSNNRPVPHPSAELVKGIVGVLPSRHLNASRRYFVSLGTATLESSGPSYSSDTKPLYP